jgi:hypothetical protein
MVLDLRKYSMRGGLAWMVIGRVVASRPLLGMESHLANVDFSDREPAFGIGILRRIRKSNQLTVCQRIGHSDPDGITSS